MANTVQEVMSPNVQAVNTGDSLETAARLMREQDIGDVVVVDDDRIQGILTDRDIVVRAIADSKHPAATFAGDCCSEEITVVEANESVDRAIDLMRQNALRRLPVVDSNRLVGIVSLGDLAMSEDQRSALADISAAQPNT